MDTGASDTKTRHDIAIVLQIDTALKVPYYTPITGPRNLPVVNRTKTVHVMTAEEQAKLHLKPFDICANNADIRIDRHYTPFVMLNAKPIVAKDAMERQPEVDIIDFQTWKTTPNNAYRARQASAGQISKCVQVLHICHKDNPLYRVECKSQHNRKIISPWQMRY